MPTPKLKEIDIYSLKFGDRVLVDVGEFDEFRVLAGIGICGKGHKRKESCDINDCYLDDGVWLFHEGDEPYTIEVMPDKIKEVEPQP